jgi:uncharacterized protein (DUF58 family)
VQGHLDSIDTMSARQFFIAVRRLADSLHYGTDSSPFLGSGIEFVQSRKYLPGDPVRTIDWRVTARTGTYYVKEFEAPKALPCYLFLDTSASMTISSTAKSKYALAVHVAGGLAFACLDRISPVGLVGVGQRELRIEPSLSRDRILQWLHKLRHFRFDEPTTLGQRLAELDPRLASRALVIVLSDLHDPKALPALRRMAQRHDVVVLQFRDPAEVHVRGAGFLRAQEAETGRGFLTLGRRHSGRQVEIDRELKRSGIDHLIIDSQQPFADRLRHFFRTRNLLGRGLR